MVWLNVLLNLMGIEIMFKGRETVQSVLRIEASISRFGIDCEHVSVRLVGYNSECLANGLKFRSKS